MRKTTNTLDIPDVNDISDLPVTRKIIKPWIPVPAKDRISQSLLPVRDNGGGVEPSYILVEPERINIFLNAIADGHFISPAASLANIGNLRPHVWRKYGKRQYERGQDTDLARFYECLLYAEAVAENTALAAWIKHTKHDWRAAERFLAKRFRKRWGDMPETTTSDTTFVIKLSMDAEPPPPPPDFVDGDVIDVPTEHRFTLDK